MAGEIYLTDRQVAERFNVCRATPWRWMRQIGFPTPIRLSPACTRWRLKDIEDWERKRASAESINDQHAAEKEEAVIS